MGEGAKERASPASSRADMGMGMGLHRPVAQGPGLAISPYRRAAVRRIPHAPTTPASGGPAVGDAAPRPTPFHLRVLQP